MTQYGAQSDAKLGILEEQLFQLKKGVDTTMRQHVKVYSALVEQIQFHLPHDKRWKDETINRRFLRTLPVSEWLPRIRATGPRIGKMTPVQLYAEIQINDEVLNGLPAANSNEANLAARIGGNGGNGGKRTNGGKNSDGKCGRRRDNKGKNNRFHPYDGFTYKGPAPDSAYVKEMKEKWRR